MTATIASMSNPDQKSYEVYLFKDENLNRWIIHFKILIKDAVVDEMLVTQMRSINPKTFNVLEECLKQITQVCSGLGVSGQLKINFNKQIWELKL